MYLREVLFFLDASWASHPGLVLAGDDSPLHFGLNGAQAKASISAGILDRLACDQSGHLHTCCESTVSWTRTDERSGFQEVQE
jgi:hypothetical protein